MKTIVVLAACVALSGCSTMGGLSGPEKLALLKGASEHLQTCARSYTLNSGIPPQSGVTIICAPTTPAPQGLTAEQVASIATEAAVKAIAAFTKPDT